MRSNSFCKNDTARDLLHPAGRQTAFGGSSGPRNYLCIAAKSANEWCAISNGMRILASAPSISDKGRFKNNWHSLAESPSPQRGEGLG